MSWFIELSVGAFIDTIRAVAVPISFIICCYCVCNSAGNVVLALFNKRPLE